MGKSPASKRRLYHRALFAKRLFLAGCITITFARLLDKVFLEKLMLSSILH
jgi:hypothetical protein